MSIGILASRKACDKVCHGHFDVELDHVRHGVELYVDDLVRQ